MNKRLKTHLMCLWMSIKTVALMVSIVTIACLGYSIVKDIAIRSEEFYKAQELLVSYNNNHVTYESKLIQK